MLDSSRNCFDSGVFFRFIVPYYILITNKSTNDSILPYIWTHKWYYHIMLMSAIMSDFFFLISQSIIYGIVIMITEVNTDAET